jgi:hypothetical protein
MSVHVAAKMFGVPLTTLRDRVDGRVHIDCCQAGVPSLFRQDEESFLVEHVKTIARLGMA